jgi:hypothetical protein
MEIGPINTVRPVTLIKPLRADVGLSGVFAVEFRKQGDDETYSSNQERATRGLEDEATPEDDLQDDAGTDASSDSSFARAAAPSKISFFA